ncbi:hypothetical protein HAX54_028435, partial [Datura stramonium]|nr:hypothetical protein [Datura stramonium]
VELENARIEDRMRIAQVVRGSHTLAQYQARRDSCLHALAGARRQNFLVGVGTRRSNISTRTHATCQQVLHDGRRETASFQRHKVCDAALIRAAWQGFADSHNPIPTSTRKRKN